MSMTDAASAAELVRQVLDDTVDKGWRAEFARGATDDEIDQMVARQNAKGVPAAFREVLRIMGSGSSPWFMGTGFGVFLDGEDKTVALISIEYAESEVGLRDPDGMLVIAEAEANFLVIDGADLHQPNLPVWVITDGNEVKKVADSVIDWFDRSAKNLLGFKATLARRRERGHPDPLREEDFRWE
ncbi:SMI1/KNR4 family protein [Nocardia sp. 2]|uniref:SMI1/KNR4 family protein n=1 Tax=Nocardia acididurans TaxID=2802282 RepID=A0ABS1M3S0_9NOCA|nr:SMI1/KNR4 family protein [Nocardia acididurans]MBL1075191.1 SMI1/KNR4 family protein [Nocardia acididurans]